MQCITTYNLDEKVEIDVPALYRPAWRDLTISRRTELDSSNLSAMHAHTERYSHQAGHIFFDFQFAVFVFEIAHSEAL